MNKQPSERTLRRARKKPRNTNVNTLYNIAKQQGKTMEELAGFPLHLFNRQVDGYVVYQNLVYMYRKQLPHIPPRNSFYVYEDNGVIKVARRDYIRQYTKIIGICVFVLKLLNIGESQHHISPISEFVKCEENMGQAV